MSDLQQCFANKGNVRVLTQRNDMRAYLRTYQELGHPYESLNGKALHFRDVDELMLCGHYLIGTSSDKQDMPVGGFVIFPDRPMPENTLNADIRTQISNMKDSCAILCHAFAKYSLKKAADILAAKNRRNCLIEWNFTRMHWKPNIHIIGGNIKSGTNCTSMR